LPALGAPSTATRPQWVRVSVMRNLNQVINGAGLARPNGKQRPYTRCTGFVEMAGSETGAETKISPSLIFSY